MALLLSTLSLLGRCAPPQGQGNPGSRGQHHSSSQESHSSSPDEAGLRQKSCLIRSMSSARRPGRTHCFSCPELQRLPRSQTRSSGHGRKMLGQLGGDVPPGGMVSAPEPTLGTGASLGALWLGSELEGSVQRWGRAPRDRWESCRAKARPRAGPGVGRWRFARGPLSRPSAGCVGPWPGPSPGQEA